MKDVKIKICGLKRLEDVELMNVVQPDYVGFIINFPKSHRSKTPQEVEILASRLDKSIQRVGVFVNQPIEVPMEMAKSGTLDVIQLHGDEDADYIQTLKAEIQKPVMNAFRVRTTADVTSAMTSTADMILLDAGCGSGSTFDWNVIPKEVTRPYFLAGGLTPENMEDAYGRLHPYGLDISSGVETDGWKDPRKVQSILEWRNT